MDRAEILKRLEAFPYDRGDYWVVAGAAMVLHGVRGEASDIDLGCTSALADRLEADGLFYRMTDDGRRWFRYGDSIEVFENWLCGGTLMIEQYHVITLDGLVEMKTRLGREKDLRDIALIRAFMGKAR